MRRGTSTVSQVTDHELFLNFRHPDTLGTTEYEGHIGNGDSGGPIVINIDGQRYVAGVGSTAHFDFTNNIFKYGSNSVYERVSTNLDWLKLTMGDDFPGQYAGPEYTAPSPPSPGPTPSQPDNGSTSGGSIQYLLAILLMTRVWRTHRED